MEAFWLWQSSNRSAGGGALTDRLKRLQVALHLRQVHVRGQAAESSFIQLQSGTKIIQLATEQHHADVEKLAAFYERHHSHNRVAVPHAGYVTRWVKRRWRTFGPR